ncbi:hypothetical protein M404DRAFT_292700 [Pisolithus tinctorius Marx 270]|uniref:Uncharacterized protein n=1 Tax=Pisolithus tinctorius Marx 270 TaxID=870435 RepID=A0A0C3NL38_PISTI|nr:hypothetical protein M404DRAFT_292700 [Pisolithus tinctorius Marx 270]
MNPRIPYPQQNQNPSVPRVERGRVSTDVRDENAEQTPRTHRIRPSGSNGGQESGSTNQVARQHENEGWSHQPSRRPILGAVHREGAQEPTAVRPQLVRNSGYDEPRNVPQQVQGPTGVRGEWTTPPSNLGAGGERGEWRHGPSYNPVPPTPQRERPTDAQGLDGWHRDTLRSLPQVRQLQSLGR